MGQHMIAAVDRPASAQPKDSRAQRPNQPASTPDQQGDPNKTDSSKEAKPLWLEACPADKNQLHAYIQRVEDEIEDATAYIQALQTWNLPGATRELSDLENRAQVLTENFNAARKRNQLCQVANANLQKRPVISQLQQEGVILQQMTKQWMQDHKLEIQHATKKFNDGMRYRYGLSYINDPRPKLLEWSVFGSGLFRLNGNFPNLTKRTTPLDVKQRAGIVLDALSEAAPYGFKPIVQVTAGGRPEYKADMSINADFIPVPRPSFHKNSFNSAYRRSEVQAGLKQWAELTRHAPNILSYQMFNEPFWSTRPDQIFSYDPGTIGCSEDTWRARLKERYSTYQHWRKAHPPMNTKTKKMLGEKTYDQLLPRWTSFEDMTFGMNAFAGLSFVDFLKKKYRDLSTLNRVWYGSNKQRHIESWDKLFPPIPKVSVLRAPVDQLHNLQTGDFLPEEADIPLDWLKRNIAIPRPDTADIPAWVDWLEFWSHAVNDEFRSYHQAMKEGGARAPVTTNAVTGHYINGFGNIAADSGLNPWITTKDMDTMGIDFYAAAYLKAYIRSMLGAAQGRPVHIHETGLLNGPKGAYALLHGYAHGADALSFWRKDNNIDPRYGIYLLQAMRLLAHEELQHQSIPLSDDLILLYSQATMRLTDAEEGHPGSYLASMQGAVLAMDRLQILYDVLDMDQLQDASSLRNKTLLLPGVRAVPADQLNILKKHVQQGGKIIATDDFALRDPYGRERPPSELAWMGRKSVLKLERDFFSSLRDRLRDDHNPNMSFDIKVDDIDKLNTWLTEHLVPATRYLKTDNSLSPAHAGARQGKSGNLYVFVDPWQKNVTLDVRGIYTQATDLSNGHVAKPSVLTGRSRIEVKAGPTIIKFTP